MGTNSATPLDICNLALLKIGQRSIGSLTEVSENARRCNSLYDRKRGKLLESCDWSFARQTVLLVLIGQLQGTQQFPDWANANASVQPSSSGDDADILSQNALQPWAYLYRYPTVCRYVRKVYNPHSPIFPYLFDSFYQRPFDERIENIIKFKITRSPVTNELAIATDMQDARADITLDIIDPSQFTEEFADALACALAVELAMPLTGDKEVVAYVTDLYKNAMTEAMRVNHSESPERAPRHSAYEGVRESGG